MRMLPALFIAFLNASVICGLFYPIPAIPAAQDLTVFQDKSTEAPDETVTETIAVGDKQPVDETIRQRLEEVYGNIDGLAGVEATVEGGVITLSGTTADKALRREAESLAGRVDGVVAVENKLQLDRQLSIRWQRASERLRNSFLEFLALLPSMLVAVIIAVTGWFIARFVGSRDGIFERLAPNTFIRRLIRQLVKAIIIIAAMVLALQILDAGALLGSLAGALGIVGLALGFATRDTVENYIASILLSLRQPFAPLDHVVIDGHEGKVARLTSRSTVLMSLDGNHIRIPNATVFKSTIVNYTRNPLRRFEFDVGVDTDLDLKEPRRLALECLSSMAGVLDEPGPLCLVSKLGDSSVVLNILAWVDQRDVDFAKVRSEALRLVKETFDAADIVMPEPVYNVNLRERPARPAQTPVAVNHPQAEPHAAQVEPDTSIEKQIGRDSAAAGEEDLLDATAPKE